MSGALPTALPWRDSALPELAQALDTRALASTLAAVPSDEARALATWLPRARLVSARYKPGQRCLLRFAEPSVPSLPASANPGVLLGLFGDDFQRRRAHGRYHDALALPELRAFLWRFPSDRKLPTLGQLTDVASVRAILSRLGEATTTLTLTPMHYLPEHGYTVRTDGHVGDTPATCFGKCSLDDRAAATLDDMAALRRTNGRFTVAEPIGFDGHSRSAWQRGLPRVRPADTGELAVALTALHASDGTRHGRDARPLQCHRPVLQRATRLLSLAFPAQAGRVAALAMRVAARVDGLDAHEGLLHGDLHPGNCFVTHAPGAGAVAGTERVAFIDLDDLHVGDVARELGSLLAHALNLACLRGEDPHATFEAMCTALAGYRAPDGHRIKPPALRAHTALALLGERATRGITRLKLPSDAHLDTLLACADELVAT